MIKGIGPQLAGRLIAAFGTRVFEVIEREPRRLRTVEGIGPTRAERITGAWREQKSVRDIMLFLHSHGVGSSRAARIFKTYGHDAIALITENPYRLAADIRGIGFLTADAVAASLGIDRHAMIRARAGIGYALVEAMDEGHCGLPGAELKEAASRLLEIPGELIERAIELELEAGTVAADAVGGTPAIFLSGLYTSERIVALRVRSQAAGPLPWPAIDADAALGWVEKRLSMRLAPMQAEAFRLALSEPVPGDHRRAGRRQDDDRERDPRGPRRQARAARPVRPDRARRQAHERGDGARGEDDPPAARVRPAHGRVPRGGANPLDCDLLVVDETSMVDVPLMHALLRAVPPRAAAGPGRRRRSAAVGRARAGAARRHRARAPCRWCG